MYPLVDELREEGAPAHYTCRILSDALPKVEKRGITCDALSYRTWVRHRDGQQSQSAEKRAKRDEVIVEHSLAEPKWGARMIARDLLEKRGWKISDSTVNRARIAHGIRAKIKAKPRSYPKPETGVGLDLVRRDFEADAPDMLWFTDITEYSSDEGKAYVCAVKDAYSRAIVGLALGPRMTAGLAVQAVHNAIATRGYVPAGCVVHSDRGSQFRSKKYLRVLKAYGLVQSMGQVGSSADNAAMESFFGVMKNNVYATGGFRTRDEVFREVRWWILDTYNCRRPQEALGGRSPAKFELAFIASLESSSGRE
ncbi:hypothetical protein C1Y63_12385, partial [Corynebacterium sp. 13CS0277]